MDWREQQAEDEVRSDDASNWEVKDETICTMQKRCLEMRCGRRRWKWMGMMQ
jgi:hypothetical protein